MLTISEGPIDTLLMCVSKNRIATYQLPDYLFIIVGGRLWI